VYDIERALGGLNVLAQMYAYRMGGIPARARYSVRTGWGVMYICSGVGCIVERVPQRDYCLWFSVWEDSEVHGGIYFPRQSVRPAQLMLPVVDTSMSLP
jgi:hypothetical protein